MQENPLFKVLICKIVQVIKISESTKEKTCHKNDKIFQGQIQGICKGESAQGEGAYSDQAQSSGASEGVGRPAPALQITEILRQS